MKLYIISCMLFLVFSLANSRNGVGCSLDVAFSITCNSSLKPPRAYFKGNSYRWIKSISDSTVRLSSMVVTRCSGTLDKQYFSTDFSFEKTPLSFSKVNMLIVIGCNDYAWLLSRTILSPSVSAGCFTFCSDREYVVRGECLGNGCCQTPIPKDIKQYWLYINTLRNLNNLQTSSTLFTPCHHAFVGDPKEFMFKGLSDLNDTSFAKRVEDGVSMVFDWSIGNMSCSEAKKTHGFACQENTTCLNSTGINGGYRCICKQGYHGNPYLIPGCQDVNECEDSEKYKCYGKCVNTLGSYNCTCPQGYIGDAQRENGCLHMADSKISSTMLYIIIALVCALVAIACGVGIWFCLKRRKLAALRAKFFEQNGGVLLRQKMNAQGSHEGVTLFSPKQLLKATNNYSEERIIGQGAYGVVYKGVLSDERVVAVKKSKVMDVNQSETFINEVMILTQVIHRHVVKLLGCCLEEEVPILVYEFIPNNTLFQHIHHISDGMDWLSLEQRMRIAGEAACALAYLHSETTMQIIHRDVKSTNILLDSAYTAKVSDFGASRLVPLDHEEVTTLVQGTLGYLDPEYFKTGQLTSKSDVYSFGVVLAELITGKKPIGMDRADNDKNLAAYFVNSFDENRLGTIVEPRIMAEARLEQLVAVGELIKRCLNLHGHERPTMKEVERELNGLRELVIRQHVPQNAGDTSTSQGIEADDILST